MRPWSRRRAPRLIDAPSLRWITSASPRNVAALKHDPQLADEAHHFAGGVRTEALEMCVALIRIGLTATPPAPGTPGAERLSDLIGPVVFELESSVLSGLHSS